MFVLFATITLLCYEIGFRSGRWWQDRMPGEQEGPTGLIVGSLLALMAFLLAITTGMAADRLRRAARQRPRRGQHHRRTYLKADYLPADDAEQMKELLREYLPLRIASGRVEETPANIARSKELHAEMWAIAARVAESGHSPDLVSSFGESLTGS